MDAPVDLAELLLAVDVLGVLAPVALGGRVGDVLHDLGPLLPEQIRELLLEPLRALARDVDRRGSLRFRVHGAVGSGRRRRRRVDGPRQRPSGRRARRRERRRVRSELSHRQRDRASRSVIRDGQQRPSFAWIGGVVLRAASAAPGSAGFDAQPRRPLADGDRRARRSQMSSARRAKAARSKRSSLVSSTRPGRRRGRATFSCLTMGIGITEWRERASSSR